MKALALLLPIAALLLCSCDGPRKVKEAEMREEISKLQSVADQYQNEIDDMEAVVVMERAKLEENSDYDQSFLTETLAEQEHKRHVLLKLQEKIKEIESSYPAAQK